MPLHTLRHIVFIDHAGTGDKFSGKALAGEMLDAVAKLAESGKPFAIVHDSSNLDGADTAYAMAFGSAFKHLPEKPEIHIAVITKPLLRHLARLASTLGGMKMTIVDSPESAQALLDEAGFREHCWGAYA